MSFPTTPISTTNLDAGTDNPSLARADLKSLVDAFNALIASRGSADGFPTLNSSGQTVFGTSFYADPNGGDAKIQLSSDSYLYWDNTAKVLKYFDGTNTYTFSNTGTGAGANALSYAEGTWTPTLVSDGGGDASRTYTTQLGQYVRIGNLVTVSGVVEINSVGTIGTGRATIAGLPFASGATHSYSGTIGYYVNAGASIIAPSVHIVPSFTSLRITGATGASTSPNNNLTPAQAFANGTQILFSISYRV